MSHMSTYGQKIQNIDYFLGVCEGLGYEVRRGSQTVRQFARNTLPAVGSFLITGWKYRVAVTSDGKLKYDHWGSKPDTMELLGEAIQEYNDLSLMKEIPYDEINTCSKNILENGDIQVVLEY